MKRKRRKMLSIAVVIFISTALYNLWTLRKVNVLYIDSYKDVMLDMVVDHLPLTDKGRIEWFLENKNQLQKNHPEFNQNTVEIIFLGIGEGFMSLRENPHEDLLCYDSLKQEKNCIEKDVLMVVDFYTNGVTDFDIGFGGPGYRVSGDGKIENKPIPKPLEFR